MFRLAMKVAEFSGTDENRSKAVKSFKFCRKLGAVQG